MNLKINQPAPDFITRDIRGNTIQLSQLQGQKVLLTFYRHVACPVHHLRFQELRTYEKEFCEKGLVVLAVYESSTDNLLCYSEGENYYARLIANPEFDLYEKYDIELNTVKLLFSMYNGGPAKAAAGLKLMKQRFKAEGHNNLMGGDFLIGEDGLLKKVYYNQFLGDHLPTKEILSFINDPDYKVIGSSTCCD